MEKLTIITTSSKESLVTGKIGEKITFKTVETNQNGLSKAFIAGEEIGLLVTKEPAPGTVSPQDLKANIQDYNWTLSEIRAPKPGSSAMYLIATGVSKRRSGKGQGKLENVKLTFNYAKYEQTNGFAAFKEARITELVPMTTIQVSDELIQLFHQGNLIGDFVSTTGDFDSNFLVHFFGNAPMEIALGAMRESEKMLDVVVPIDEAQINQMKIKASSLKFEAKIKEIVKNKITTRENIEEILAYLTTCGVDSKMQLAVLETYKAYPKEIKALIKPKPPVPFVDQHGFIKTSIAAINKEKHLRYDGPKGSGKNLAIETLSWVYQRPLFRVSFNKQTDESVLFGEKTLETKSKRVSLEETSENSRTAETIKVFAKNMTNLMSAMLGKTQDVIFERGPLTLAMEYGGFLNLDEINFANQANASVLNNALDDNRSVYVPGHKLVNAVENFVAISTMNDGYIGTSPMNQALRDRFYPVMFQYPADMSTFLKVRYPNANADYLRAIDSIYEDMVNHVRDIQDLDPDAISTRGFIDVMDLADDLGLEEALTGAIVNRADNDDTRDLLRNIIDMHV